MADDSTPTPTTPNEATPKAAKSRRGTVVKMPSRTMVDVMDAARAMEGFAEPTSFEEALDDLNALCDTVMIERQQKYGPNNISLFGLLGILVRLGDKVMRLRHLLLENGAESSDETIIDSFVDIHNYATIGLMLLTGTWGLPLEEEMDSKEPKK